MDDKERQTMGAAHSLLYRELLVTQNKLAEEVEWVKHVFGEDRKAVAAALARAEVLEVAFDNSHQLNEQLGNENRALLARAEAAEAERDELRDANDVLSDALKDTRQVLEEVTARVAELEAALAAQGWQPVTITEPSPDFTVELIVVGYRGDDGYWHYPDGPEGLVIRGWRPVPPSVALREPTP